MSIFFSSKKVDVEALVIQGPKLATVLSQVKKLEVSVLVLGQKKSAPLISWCVISTVRFLFPIMINNYLTFFVVVCVAYVDLVDQRSS